MSDQPQKAIKVGDRVWFFDKDQQQVDRIMGVDYRGEWGTVVAVYGDEAVVHGDKTDTSFPWPVAGLWIWALTK